MKETEIAKLQNRIEELKVLLEQKNRELEIEAALEKVRSSTMAMRSSDELRQVISVVYKELAEVGVDVHLALILIYDWQTKQMEWWSSGQGIDILPVKYQIQIQPEFENHPWLIRYFEAQKNKTEFEFYTLEGEIKRTADNYLFEKTDMMNMPEEFKRIMRSYDRIVLAEAFMKRGVLSISVTDELPPEEVSLIKRFARVIDAAFNRVEELRLAETQAREAQIEASLERVRGRAMAIRKSDELKAVITLIFKELNHLGFDLLESSLMIFVSDSKDLIAWGTGPNNSDLASGTKLQYFEHPFLDQLFQDIEAGKKFRSGTIGGTQLKTYLDKLYTITDFKNTPKELMEVNYKVEEVHYRQAIFEHGFLELIGTEPIPVEKEEIIKRFAKVIDLTYTRFDDIVQAETQAREAQIEAALERVRSRTMGMQKSSELQEVINRIFVEITGLGVTMDSSYIITHLDQDMNKGFYAWVSINEQSYASKLHQAYLDHPLVHRFYKAWNEQEPHFAATFSKAEKDRYFSHQFKYSPQLSQIPEQRKKVILDGNGWSLSWTILKKAALIIQRYQNNPFREDEINIQKRFAKVFEQTYTRFLDLQKAETQAREAEIQLAFERVRARALAMHKSDELMDVAMELRTQMGSLGQKDLEVCAIHLYEEDDNYFESWGALRAPGKEGKLFLGVARFPNSGLKIVDEMFQHYKTGSKDYVLVNEGEKGLEWLNALKKYSPDAYAMISKKIENTPTDQLRAYWSVSDFSGGALVMVTYVEPDENSKNLLRRSANVFDLAYRRHKDLKVAEDQAKQAIKQASLDRVRGEIASMRTSEDLNRITPVIWRELQVLEVPFFRCGVFIFDEIKEKVGVYLSTPEGKAIAALNLSFDANDLTKNTVEHWRMKRIFRTHWNRVEFMNWARSMVQMGQVGSAESYQGAAEAPESLNLHFVPFSQGMLYVGDVNPLPNDKIDLVKNLAESFSIAYARYEDFKNLEEAKNKIEMTLSELKSTQAQLIHSEKMASLGELTAGIAHEIQNPLNFVNNFSDLNAELIDELKEELAVGNTELANEIAEDIKGNEQKINHHGKRAESIVKGMLQHSRTSNGQKEPTDINALADEYLRLAYHGLKAKDKSFNADFKTDFYPNLPKIKVIPQDIGRVLLNLINNAFYAVDKKAKELIPLNPPKGGAENPVQFKPIVTITTSHSLSFGEGRGEVKISVKDNGNGIPDSIKDKIFQPFFTTKPTGSGTGLGLSLSYDIVKAHGGEIKVKSQINKGTEFTILLPA